MSAVGLSKEQQTPPTAAIGWVSVWRVQIGEWGNCSLACGGGIQERAVRCVDEQGAASNESFCGGMRPADQLQCNVMPCDFCSLTNCAGQVRPPPQRTVLLARHV